MSLRSSSSAARAAIARCAGGGGGAVKGKQRQTNVVAQAVAGAAQQHACGFCTSSSAAAAASTSAGPSAATASAGSASTTLANPKPSGLSGNALRNGSSGNLIRPMRIVPSASASVTSLPPSASQVKQNRALVRKGGAGSVQPTYREQQIAKLYALEAIPSRTALSALANRISPDLLGRRSGKDAEHILRLVELCCTSKTFWQVVAEQEAVLQRKAQAEDAASVNDAAEKQYTNFLDAQRDDNESLAVLGNHLLGTFATEWLEAKYPNLPAQAAKAALTLFVGPRTCADVASKSWGITSGHSARTAFLDFPAGGVSPSHKPGQPLRGVGEGNRSGAGLLRWGRSEQAALEAVKKSHAEGDDSRSTNLLPLEEALAASARAIVGLVYQEHGFGAVRTFVHSVFLSRQADLTTLLKFANPKATLTHTLSKYAGQGLEAPVTRLVAETGRLSISPIFVSGVYSGARKLGEGFGSSLKMSEFRANEDALRRIYLSPSARPLLAPEDADSTHGQGAGELPTDTLVYPGRRLARTRALPDDETLYQSAGKSGVVAGSR